MARFYAWLMWLRTTPRRWGFVVIAGAWSVLLLYAAGRKATDGLNPDNHAATVLLVVWLVGLGVVALVGVGANRIVEKPRERPCPRCGRGVRVGEMECPECGFDFWTIGS